MLYLDHAASSPLLPAARAAMDALRDVPLGHPQARHRPGRRAAAVVQHTREAVAATVGAAPSWVILTSGGTEANAAAMRHLVGQGGRVVTCVTEHAAVLAPLRAWGAEVTEVGVDAHGRIDLHALDRALDGAAALVLMAANNETGVVHPLDAVAGLARAHEVWWHCDAVGALGRTPIDLHEGPWRAVSSLAVASHKVGGPPGVGALVSREPVRAWQPGLRADAVRAGTPDVVGLAGWCAALGEPGGDAAAIAAVRDRWETEVSRRWPDSRVHGAGAPRLPGTSFVSLRAGDWGDAETIVEELALRDVCVGSGAACMTGMGRPSHVLTAMGVAPDVAGAAVRVSWGRDAHDRDVDVLLEALADVLG